MDYRGRGRSDHAKDWKTYHPLQELADAMLLLDRLDIDRAAVIGTSRGGIIAMLMASLHPERLVGALLNDIGPRIDTAGLLRLANTVGRADTFPSWKAAVEALKHMSPGFESLSEKEWRGFAARLFRESPAGIRADYDTRLVQGLPPTPAAAEALPELWTNFAALVPKPVAVLRAEHSDFLSVETVERMKSLHPGMIAATVKDRGHVPFLDEPECRTAISAWLAACDAVAGA